MRTHLDHGTEVTNFGVHDPFSAPRSNRPNLARDILRQFGAHPMGCEIPVDRSERELRSIRDQLVAGAKLKGEVSRWLLGARQCDFFITVFAECHRAGHVLWPDGLTVARHPTIVRNVGRLPAGGRSGGSRPRRVDLSQTTVMLFSLHGMGVNISKNYFLQDIMDRVNEGFAAREPGVFGSTRPKQRGLISRPAGGRSRVAAKPGREPRAGRGERCRRRSLLYRRTRLGLHARDRTPIRLERLTFVTTFADASARECSTTIRADVTKIGSANAS